MAFLKYQRNRLIILSIVALLGGVVFLMYQGIIPGIRENGGPVGPSGPAPVTLEFWNVFEGEEVYSPLISDFKTLNPHITINYTKIEFSEYRRKLTEAFANGTAPDIFAIHNTWLPLQESRISPAPASLASVAQFRDIFPRVVEFDFVRETEDGQSFVYALPLGIETLGLFYNKDYFETANITSPPKTWEELLDYVKLFTQFDDTGAISLSGISLGTVHNINRATDILTLLMMQSGTPMNNELLSEATFDDASLIGEEGEQKQFSPGKEALEFYLAFSDKTKPIYSWDRDMPYSIDAFVEGKSAMMINYPHHISTVKGKAPHLNFALAPAPKLAGQKEDINYANYWGLTSAKQSQKSATAWEFIDFMLSPENLKKYLEAANMPTSRRDLILWQQKDPDLKHFANQILSARSWYQGDSSTVESIMKDMLESTVVGELLPQEALEDAAARITVIIQKVRE